MVDSKVQNQVNYQEFSDCLMLPSGSGPLFGLGSVMIFAQNVEQFFSVVGCLLSRTDVLYIAVL